MEHPKMLETVAEVVDDMTSQLNIDEIIHLRKLFDKDYDSEFTLEKHFASTELGRYIRNTYGLWQDNEKLAEDCARIDKKTAEGTLLMWENKARSFLLMVCFWAGFIQMMHQQ